MGRRGFEGQVGMFARTGTPSDAEHAAPARGGKVWRTSNTPCLVVDTASGQVRDANRAAETLWGYSTQELIGAPLARLIDSTSFQHWMAAFQEAKTGVALDLATVVQQDGSRFEAKVRGRRPRPLREPGIWCLLFEERGNNRRMSDMRRMNWAMGAYARSASALIRSPEPQAMMQRVCDAIVEEDVYILACITLKTRPECDWLDIVAHAGSASGYIEGLRISASDQVPEGRGPSGQTFRSGRAYVVRDAASETSYAPWQARAKVFNVRSQVAQPITHDGKTFGTLQVYARVIDAFGAKEVTLLRLLADEIGFAIALAESKARAERDQRARREAELRAKSAQEELHRLARISLVGEFSAALAHEINQPLGATLLNAETAIRWLDSNPPNLAETRAALARIHRDTGRANEIIARVRRLHQGGVASIEPFDLRAALEEILLMTEDRCRRGEVAVEVSIPHDFPPVVGDRVGVQQVLLNLVVNALEALEASQTPVRKVSLSVSQTPDRMALLRVQDTGPGMPPETAARLFERFFTTKKAGTGLGLAIARTIVDTMGGRIWTESSPDSGALVCFTIPLGTQPS